MNIKNKPSNSSKSKSNKSKSNKPKSNKSKPLKKTTKRTKGGEDPKRDDITDEEKQNREKGIYNFTDEHKIHFFADLEGDIPEGIARLIYENDPNDEHFKDKLNYTNLNDRLIVRRDLYTTKTVIVFTGDLIDRGPKSIRLLQDMIELKKLNYDNVIFTCGNRDINKIRFKKEFFVEIIDRILSNEDYKKINISIKEIYDRLLINFYKDNKNILKFKNGATTIKDTFPQEGIISFDIKNIKGEYIINFDKFYKDDISRVWTIYNCTLGAPLQLNFFINEYNILFDNLFDEEKINTIDNIKILDNGEVSININEAESKFYLFVVMMNMVMSKIYDETKLPDCLIPYNGLYIKHLQNCHIMANINIGNKIIFASHSGVPFYINNDISDEYEYKYNFHFPKILGYSLSVHLMDRNLKIKDITYNIINLNTNFINFLDKLNGYNIDITYSSYIQDTADNSYKSFINTHYEDKHSKVSIANFNNIINDYNDEYKKYVGMSANCPALELSDKTTYNKDFSPIVTIGSLSEKGPLKYLEYDKDININDVKNKTIYNIFGHQPSGVLPQITKVRKTYHIDLDISMADYPHIFNDNSTKITNNESYVYLTINNEEDILTGFVNSKRTLLQHKNIPKYKMYLAEYAIHDINDFPVEKDKNIYVGYYAVGDKNTYYGLNGFNIQEKTKKEDEDSFMLGGGIKKYKKSIKRFTNGKRKMVIYLGKRGGEYVKVKGRYISIIKYKKILKSKTSKK